MRREQAGFTLPELLVTLVLVSVVAAGVGGVFASQNRAYRREDLQVALDENLRMATGMVADTLRNAGCGMPNGNLASWIPWVSGFANSPILTVDGGDQPDTLSVAACTPTLATVTSFAPAGATTLVVESTFPGATIAEILNDDDKSLIWINHLQHASITSVSGNTITIDTDPTTSGNQGLARPKLPGAPITRVDVFSFAITDDAETGLPRLELDKQRGTPVSAADGITDLQVTTLVPGRQYRVTLTGRSERTDPTSGLILQRSSDVEVAVRN